MSYISPRTKAFSHLDRLAGWQAGQQPAPVTVEWDLSNACSLKCAGCHFAHTHVKGPWSAADTAKPEGYTHTGRFADAPLVFKGLTEMADAGVKAIVWSGGGEPTLHPEWPAIVAYAGACGLAQGMYSLGGHLSDEQAQIVGEHLSWIVVSLDAERPDLYAIEKGVPQTRWHDACAGVRRLSAQSGLVVGVSFLLHQQNYMRVHAMRDLARALGATYVTFRPTVNTSPAEPSVITSDRAWIDHALKPLSVLAQDPFVEVDLQRFRDYRGWTGHGYSTCYGVRLVTMVTPDGRVWLCPNRRGVAGSEIGDLSRESFADVWAKHPGRYQVDGGCRAMCRLHLVNQSLTAAFTPQHHEAFV